MKYASLLLFLCITVLTIQNGESWGWFKRAFRKVKEFYHNHKWWINPVGNAVVKAARAAATLGKKDVKAIASLAALKTYDRESYDEFKGDVWVALEDEYSYNDLLQMMDQMDELADMDFDEIDLLRADNDEVQDDDVGNDKLIKNLADRVAALNMN